MGILILISFFVTAFPRFSLAQYSQQQVTPQTSSQGEVLGIKETFERFYKFATDPTGNVVKWIVGGEDDQGLIGGILYAIARILGGDAVNIKMDQQGAVLPSGAIVMPSGDWYLTGGVAGTTKEFIASTVSNPPASGVYYAAGLLDRAGVKTAYANPSGLDFDDNQPVFRLWKHFRGLAFGLFAIAFVVLGLMIMFRVKISPQLVLTIEHALPKIILVLLLVAFSYAIAGFLVDLMYVMISIVVTFLDILPGSSFLGEARPTPKNVMGLGILAFGPPYALAAVAAANLSAGLGAIIGLVAFPATIALGAAAGLFIFIILLLLILYWMIRLIIELAKSYLYIIFHIIFAPLHIFMGVFPNSAIGFGSWFRNIFANILVFPAVVAVMMIGLSLSTATSAAQGSIIWTPPLISSPTYNVAPLEYVQQAGSTIYGFTIPALISIAIFSFLPKIPGKIREMMGSVDLAAGFSSMMGGMALAARPYAVGQVFDYGSARMSKEIKKLDASVDNEPYGPERERLETKSRRLGKVKGWWDKAHETARLGKHSI